MNISFSDIVSILALILAAYSTKRTVDFNNKQKDFIENNDRLNKLLIEKETEELISKKSADLSANLVNVGKSSYRLKIYNRGQRAARNVRIEILDGADLLIKSDINSKFPLEILERQQGVELIAAVHSQSPDKATVKLIWNDDTGNDKSNIIIVTV